MDGLRDRWFTVPLSDHLRLILTPFEGIGSTKSGIVTRRMMTLKDRLLAADSSTFDFADEYPVLRRSVTRGRMQHG